MPYSRDRVSSGQVWKPMRAAFNNRLADLASIQTGQGEAERTANAPTQNTTVFVYNGTGTEVDPGEVVGLGDPIQIANAADETLELVALDHAAPTAGTWAVASRGIGKSEAEECVLTGVAWAEVNITDDAHTHADIVGSTLTSATSGYAKILYKPAGTGTNWCCLQLGFSTVGTSTDVASLSECLCRIEALLCREIELSNNMGDDFSPGKTMSDEIAEIKAECGCVEVKNCSYSVDLEAPSSLRVIAPLSHFTPTDQYNVGYDFTTLWPGAVSLPYVENICTWGADDGSGTVAYSYGTIIGTASGATTINPNHTNAAYPNVPIGSDVRLRVFAELNTSFVIGGSTSELRMYVRFLGEYYTAGAWTAIGTNLAYSDAYSLTGVPTMTNISLPNRTLNVDRPFTAGTGQTLPG